jgi:hypothetical protein
MAAHNERFDKIAVRSKRFGNVTTPNNSCDAVCRMRVLGRAWPNRINRAASNRSIEDLRNEWMMVAEVLRI